MSPEIIGIIIKLISVTLVLLLSVAVKTFPDDAPITQIVFFRVFVSLPFVLGYIYFHEGRNPKRLREKLTPHRFSLHLRRAFLGLFGMSMIFFSVRLIPLPIAQAIRELQPVVITLLAALFLGETIRIYRTTGLILGLIGVALVVYQMFLNGEASGEFAYLQWGVLAALAAVMSSSIVQIQLRSMVQTEHPEAIVFWFFTIGAVVTLCTMPFGWVWLSAKGWLWCLLIGILGAASQLTLTTVYRYANASTVAPFEYFSIPLSLLIGGVFFHEWPRPLALIGIGFILAGGLIIIYRESQLARKKHHDLQDLPRG